MPAYDVPQVINIATHTMSQLNQMSIYLSIIHGIVNYIIPQINQSVMSTNGK